MCRCIHCSSGSHPTKAPNELSVQEHIRLIEEARDLGATVLSLSGGDPIVYPEISVLIERAVDLGYDRILFYTSGIWDVDYNTLDCPGGDLIGTVYGLDAHPDLEMLMEMGGDRLVWIFSLHSHKPTVHDFIMGITGAWHTTTSCITYLTGTGQEVEVHMVPMLPNHRHIPKMRDLCKEMGVGKLSLLRFVPQTRGFSNKSLLNVDKQDFETIQQILHAEYTAPGRKDHPVSIRAGCPIDFRHMIHVVDGKQKPCHAGLDLILVRPDGSVHPCAAWKTLPDDANVKHQSLEEIWKSAKVFSALREYHVSGYKNRGGQCQLCKYEESCKGGCPAQRLHAYGKDLRILRGPHTDPLCTLGL